MAEREKIITPDPMPTRAQAEPPPTEDEQMTPAEIFLLLTQDLALVEEEFEREMEGASPVIASVARYLHEGGGKRLRPVMVMLAARLVNDEAPRAAIRLGAVMEMLHSATLLHDDIIDEARVRRGRPSANARWGNDVTVLVGDWLYMTAFDMSLRERNFDILEALTAMTRRMVEGEIMQLSLLGNSHITREEHLEIVRRKTAYMFSACAEVGAIVAGASRAERQALTEYGLSVGIAFQLIDDVLDFVSTEDKLGKPVANDLREGKLTLPLIYLMEENNAAHREMIETVMRERGFVSVAREDVLRLIDEHGTLDRARAEARRYTETAAQALSLFPPSPYRKALLSVPRFIIERDM